MGKPFKARARVSLPEYAYIRIPAFINIASQIISGLHKLWSLFF
jgi:hypothetical protein